MKTKEEIAIKHGFIKGASVYSRTDLIEESLYAVMEEYAKQQAIDFAEYLSTHFVPTSQNGVFQYWQQKNYQGKLKLTTDEVYRIYVAEPPR